MRKEERTCEGNQGVSFNTRKRKYRKRKKNTLATGGGQKRNNQRRSSLLLVLTLLLTTLGLLLGLSLVHLVEQAERGSLELVGLGLEVLGGGSALARLVLDNELAESGNLLLDAVSLGLVEAVLEVLESLLGVIQDAVGTVGSLNGGLALLVSLTVLLGILDHGLDLSVGQTGAGSDGDGLVLVGGLVLGVDVNNGVSVNVEGDLDLRNTTVGRRDANKLEVTEELVVLDELTLTLEDLDLDSGLHVSSGGEGLGLLGGNGGVAVDQTSEDTAEGLDTEGKGSNIEQENVGNLTSQDSTLDSGTDGNSLVGVDRLGGVTAEHGLDGLGDLGHTGHTTDQDNVLDVGGLEVGILEGLADGLGGTADQRVNQRLELGTGHLLVDVQSATGASADEGKGDLGLEGRGQLNLSLLGSLTDTLDSHAVIRKVNARLLLELLDDEADEVNVKVLTTKVGVTVGGLDLEHTLLNLENGDIESTTTQIVDGDDTVVLLLHTVGKGGSSRLVNDTEDVETGDLTGILGSLTLRVVEVGGDSNDSVLNGPAQVGLGGLLHLVQNETTDLRRRVLLATGLDPGVTVGMLDNLVGDLLNVTLDLSVGELATNQTLCGEQSVLGVDNGLTLGGNTDEALAILGETNDGGSSTGTCLRIELTSQFLNCFDGLAPEYPECNFRRSDHLAGEKNFPNLPSAFSMILGAFPSITATAELVVPVVINVNILLGG